MSATPSTSTPDRAASKADTRLSVADLRSSNGAFQWYEAAAIAQGLCRAINESRDKVTGAELTLSNVFVDPEGTLSISARPDPAGAAPQLKKLLVEMLASSAVEKARLLPESSLQDLSRALEGYERADRVGVLKDLRGRWRPPAAQAFDEMFGPKKAESEAKATTRRRRGLRLVAVAAFAAATIGVAALALSTPHLDEKIRGYAAAVAPNTDPAAASSPSPSDESKSTQPAGGAATAHPSRSKVAPPRSDAQTPGATNHVAMSRRLAASSAARSKPAPMNPPERATVPTAPNVEPAESAAGSPVFDATQRDVVPPSFLPSGSMARLATAASPKENTVAIEVMVNERGTIDAVKAQRPPRSLAESMQMMNDLSAAKNWRFRPAMKDGYPVKYRLVVPIIMR